MVRAAPQPKPEEVNFTSLESPSLQFLPRRQEAPGWRLDEDPMVMPGDHLESYLDQDAVHLQRYEPLDLTVGKYTATDGAGFATVEIFRFPDFVKAFGAYSMRKDGGYRILKLANESFQKTHSIHIWRGPFYVRVTGEGGEGALLKLASSVADRMPTAPGKPAVFNFFPESQRVANSERFAAEAGFGQAYLANSFQATFDIGGDLIEGLIVPAASKNAASKILAAYRNLYVRNGKLLDPVPNLGEENFTGEDKYLGRAVAFRIDRFVIAFTGFKDRQHLVDLASATDQRILATIRKQLVTAENAPDNTANRSKPGWTPRP